MDQEISKQRRILITITLSLSLITMSSAQVSIQPIPIGGWGKLQAAIEEQLDIPYDNKVSGVVFVETTIDKEGKMKAISVVKGIGSYADEKVESAVKKLNYPFIKGQFINGPVEVKLIFPVYYDLTPQEIAQLKSPNSN